MSTGRAEVPARPTASRLPVLSAYRPSANRAGPHAPRRRGCTRPGPCATMVPACFGPAEARSNRRSHRRFPAVPLYEFVCRSCSHTFEELVSGTSLPPCPACAASNPEKVLSSFAVGHVPSAARPRGPPAPAAAVETHGARARAACPADRLESPCAHRLSAARHLPGQRRGHGGGGGDAVHRRPTRRVRAVPLGVQRVPPDPDPHHPPVRTARRPVGPPPGLRGRDRHLPHGLGAVCARPTHGSAGRRPRGSGVRRRRNPSGHDDDSIGPLRRLGREPRCRGCSRWCGVCRRWPARWAEARSWSTFRGIGCFS